MKAILFPYYNFDYEYLKKQTDKEIYEAAKKSAESIDDSEPRAFIFDSITDFMDDINTVGINYLDLENNFVMFVNV